MNKQLNNVISGIFGNGRFKEDHGREELRQLIRNAGHNSRTEVSSKTDYPVVPDIDNWQAYNVGPSKMQRARQLGIKIITDQQLHTLLAA